jgi:hypothetical protein
MAIYRERERQRVMMSSTALERAGSHAKLE